MARKSVPGGSVVVAMRVSSLAVTLLALSRCGSAFRQTIAATPREITKRTVRIVLAGMTIQFIEDVSRINVIRPPAAIATP